MSVSKPFIISQRTVFWLITFLAMIGFFWLFRSVLLPFVAGAALAYLLDPVADYFERLGFSRLWATVTILIIFILFFALALIIVIPILFNQLASFVDYVPGALKSLRDLLVTSENPIIQRMLGEGQKAFEGFSTDMLGEITAFATSFLSSLISSGAALVDIISLLVVAPVVAFYLLYDWDRMIAKVDSWLPVENADRIRQLGRDINSVISGFIRGQGGLCLILGLFYAFALTAIGLNFGLLIGLFAGLISFIPFLGSILGLVISVAVAIVQFWPEYWFVAIVIAIFLFGQFVEGNILQPKLIGDSVDLHPVWLMFALFAFGSLMGFTGMLIAVPAAAAIGVIVRFGLDQYLNSAYYQGSGLSQTMVSELGTPDPEKRQLKKTDSGQMDSKI